MLSVDFDMMYCFKCVMFKYPITTQIILTGLFSIAGSILFQVLEGFSEESSPILFLDAIWLFFIVINKIGYGDVNAYTNLGRISILLIALVGTFLISFIITSVQRVIQLKDNETKAFTIISRLSDKDFIRSETEKLTYKSLRYNYLKKKLKEKLFFKENTSVGEIDKIKKELKSLLRDKIITKETLKKSLQNFYNDYDPYDVFETINKRVDDINSTCKSVVNNSEVMIEKLSKIDHHFSKLMS